MAPIVWDFSDWRAQFPHPEPRDVQTDIMGLITETLAHNNRRGIVVEAPTGIGKTALGITFLRTIRALNAPGALVMVTSTKALVNQISDQYPNIRTMYGRNEYPCALYHARGIDARADEIPCLMLVKRNLCPHHVPSLAAIPRDVDPCQYYLNKAEVEEHDGIIVCTAAYFLLNKLFLNHPGRIAGLVIDEVDRIADIARAVFTYDITDTHLKRIVALLRRFDERQANLLHEFLMTLIRIAQLKPAMTPTLLEPHEIRILLEKLREVALDEVEQMLGVALASGAIDPITHQEDLTAFEKISHSLRRYLHSFFYALGTEQRNPLNYVFAYYEKRTTEPEGPDDARYRLRVRAHYVAPLIARCLQDAGRVLAYSATVGNQDPFWFETGVRFPVYSFPSPFPHDHLKIFMPSDVPNLAVKKRGSNDIAVAVDMMAKTAGSFQRRKIRSLAVVQSEHERDLLQQGLRQKRVPTLTYGETANPREALTRFRNGEAKVLLGTAAQYGRGIDLPDVTAETVLDLRPGYARPNDPASQFEAVRFGTRRWALIKWRVTNELRQVIGRIIRGPDDIGVVIFFSQHFKDIRNGLPEWLASAWQSDKTLQQCIREAMRFLKK